MDALSVILAAFMATVVIRKLPGIRGLVERGVKPFACDACAAAWATLAWRIPAFHWTWGTWLRDTAALAGAVYLLLSAYRWALLRVGLPDADAPIELGSYDPPRDPT